MEQLKFVAMSEAQAQYFRNGGLDANGQEPERVIAQKGRNPCRHCLQSVGEGEPMLILAYRPFETRQPYAELGPIFLHAEACPRYKEVGEPPELYRQPGSLIVRGYDANERIVYGTGSVTPTEKLSEHCSALLQQEEVSEVHVRSSGYNCFQFRVLARGAC